MFIAAHIDPLGGDLDLCAQDSDYKIADGIGLDVHLVPEGCDSHVARDVSLVGDHAQGAFHEEHQMVQRVQTAGLYGIDQRPSRMDRPPHLHDGFRTLGTDVSVRGLLRHRNRLFAFA